jgi:hypothetical protein
MAAMAAAIRAVATIVQVGTELKDFGTKQV